LPTAAAARTALRGGRVIVSGRQAEKPEVGERVLIAGAGAGGRLLVKELRRSPAWGYQPVGFVDDDQAKVGRKMSGLRVLGRAGDIPELVKKLGVAVVIIAVPSASPNALARLKGIAALSNARVRVMPDLGALLRGEAGVGDLTLVPIDAVLGRAAVEPDLDRCRQFIAGRRVLITGAAGSIGQELLRQVACFGPSQVVGLDINETGLFDLQQELAGKVPGVDFQPVLASVTNTRRLRAVFAKFRPEIVFHAAAYKHVPLMEEHPEEATMVNAVGTYKVARVAATMGVDRFVLVSTDKAVRPSSVMGATKRTAELAVRAVAQDSGLSACAVRFGNVLGSRGSVIPTFEQQIAAGGPITVTDPEMKRYFMSIPEAASLIVQAGAFGDSDAIYMLDMGEEVSIVDLAKRMIRLRGLQPGRDIEIVYTGLRPGEKLREELSLTSEIARPTEHVKVRLLEQSARFGLRQAFSFSRAIRELAEAAVMGDLAQIRQQLFAIVAEADGVPEVAPVVPVAAVPFDAQELAELRDRSVETGGLADLNVLTLMDEELDELDELDELVLVG
jgi:FlaA1/EpsC-like NDP-sugar epimerase